MDLAYTSSSLKVRARRGDSYRRKTSTESRPDEGSGLFPVDLDFVLEKVAVRTWRQQAGL